MEKIADLSLTGPQLAQSLRERGERLSAGEGSQPFGQMLCFSVYAAQLAFNRLYKQLLAPHGLTYLQYLVLVALSQADDRTVSQLGEALFLESSTLTPLLKRMEAAGHVTRRRDGHDERVVRIALTPAGRVAAQAVDCVPLDVLEALDLPLADLEAMKRTIDRMSAAIRDDVG